MSANSAQQAKLSLSTPVSLCYSSAVSPEDLLGLALSRKLTFSVAKGTAKAQAQKWIDKKLKPKESLLSVPGVDYHIMMVCKTAECHTSWHIQDSANLQLVHVIKASRHMRVVSPWSCLCCSYLHDTFLANCVQDGISISQKTQSHCGLCFQQCDALLRSQWTHIVIPNVGRYSVSQLC